MTVLSRMLFCLIWTMFFLVCSQTWHKKCYTKHINTNKYLPQVCERFLVSSYNWGGKIINVKLFTTLLFFAVLPPSIWRSLALLSSSWEKTESVLLLQGGVTLRPSHTISEQDKAFAEESETSSTWSTQSSRWFKPLY